MKPLYTLKGSKIQRYKNNVGKEIHGCIYVHRNYMEEVIPRDILEKALKNLGRWYWYYIQPPPSFNTVVYNLSDNSIRFDSSTNFDIDREPCANKFFKVFTNGNVILGHTKSIWHHKWLWVKDDYSGFNVKESYNWSKTWLGKITSPSGSASIWKNQLKKARLI